MKAFSCERRKKICHQQNCSKENDKLLQTEENPRGKSETSGWKESNRCGKILSKCKDCIFSFKIFKICMIPLKKYYNII